MGLWQDITSWIDPTVDWVAEALNYTDETVDILDDTGAIGMTAGDYLKQDVKDFFDSDTFGFIREGAGALLRSQGYGEGKDAKMPLIQQTKFQRANRASTVLRGSQAMTRTSPITGNPVNIGYQRADVQSYLTALAQNSYNQQMKNMFSQYTVPPMKPIGQKTVGLGSTQVKGISKKSRTTSKRDTS
jgi:hypothetical protein|tara:strand:- start:35 stop:595 length:561 start_codon:yes stop_codon:yes gene_type:complete